ncbi:MAG TPA: T9SS type A sorting domain-containing protein [Candidatus Kapabacteria bacterium]|nr:T9SS type A sorting domain-containing protein [Candidatus Kapabacteria bacterium]
MRSTICVVIFSLFAVAGFSQKMTSTYPFTISSLDTVTGTQLPIHSEQITPVSRISSVDGHFVINGGTTHPQRIRLFGTELWVTSNFLDRDHAHRFAQHLRKLGFNALRLSYNDYNYGLCYNDPVTGSYTPYLPAFAMMDTLLYELKQQGIYVILSLHYAHYFSAVDGVAQSDTVHSCSAFVHFIDTRAAELHREWAKTLLGHTNPLTGTRLADDPGIAAIQIAGDQEVSLLEGWRYGYLNYQDNTHVINHGGVTIGYNRSRRLDTLFSQYLIRKYKSDAGINAGWTAPGVGNAIENLVDNGSFEQAGSPAWSYTQQNGALGDKSLFGTAPDGQFCMWLILSKLSANPSIYDAYLVNTTVRLKKDSLYELKFWAKVRYNSAAPVLNRSMYIVLNNQTTGTNSLAETPTIDTGWKQYSYTFRSTNDGAQYLYYFIGNSLGDVMLDGVSIKLKEEVGLLPGETSTNFMIGRVPFASSAQLPFQRYRDMILFYDSLQNDYFVSISKCIKDTIKSAMLINNYSPVYWGTYVDAYANRSSDFTGGGINRDYPYYSAVPSPAVTDSSWQILNNSVLNDLYAGVLGRPTCYSLEGKPHILSIFWTPHINQHQQEIAPYLAAYASLQDWDGMFIGPYAYYREDLDSDFVQRGGRWWAMAGIPSMLSQLPAASDMFRNFKVDAAPTKVTIARDNDDLLLWGVSGHFSDPFGVEGGLSSNIATKYRIRGSFGSSVHKIASEYPYIFDTTTKISETEQLHWSQTGKWFTAKSPKYEAAIGSFSGDTVTLGTLQFSRLDTHNDELSISLTSRDTNDLSKSGNLFLTIGNRSGNTGWKWSGDTTIHNNWGTGPTVMSAAILNLFIPSDSNTVTIHTLAADGTFSGREYSAVKRSEGNIFEIRIDQTSVEDFHSPWYWIEESNIVNTVHSNSTEQLSTIAVYPNPSITASLLQVRLYGYSTIKVSIYDDLGREVLVIANGELSAGNHTIPFSAAALEAGHYTVQLRSNTGVATTSLVIVK